MRKLFLFIVIVAIALSGCARKEEVVPEKAELIEEEAVEEATIIEEKPLEQKVLQFDLAAYTEKGVKSWEVKGESADLTGDIIELKNLIARTYGEERTLELKADEGLYNKTENTMHLEKNVSAITSDGAKVLANSMDWKSDDNTITTDELVEVQRDEIKLWGKGVKGEPELRKVLFNEDVRIEMNNGATVITCDGPLDIDYESNLAIFYNNVKIIDAGGKITADKLEAYLNPETKTIIKALAKGDVIMLKDGNYTRSKEAIYFADEHRIVLLGRPQVIVYPDEELDIGLFGDNDEQ